MQFNQASARGQGGFTLIELIVVIVILGILAATALPKFTDMGSEARRAKMAAARGSVASAVAITRAQWLVNGDSAATTVKLEGKDITTNTSGYVAAASLATAAGLDANDYKVDGTVTPAVISDTKKGTCSFTYNQADGTVGSAPAVSNC